MCAHTQILSSVLRTSLLSVFNTISGILTQGQEVGCSFFFLIWDNSFYVPVID